jgi:hypothetical protein
MKRLRVGDWVEVRSKEEILARLDKRGSMEGLPFMPQMFEYCGQRYQVYKRAHKTCEWVYTRKSRRLPNGVHLNLRCDGEAYGGCQTACLIFWKEVWLKRVENGKQGAVSRERSATNRQQEAASSKPSVPLDPLNPGSLEDTVPRTPDSSAKRPLEPSNPGPLDLCTEEDVLAATRSEEQKAADEPRYRCQGTQVPEFTTTLNQWDMRQYLEDYTSGNFTLGSIFMGLYNTWAKRPRLGRPLRSLYNMFQGLKNGMPFPWIQGTVPPGERTPTCTLNLQTGEMVRVKSYEDILATLDAMNANRGLSFDPEMAPYCGGIYRVKTRMNKFVDEKTGKLVTMKKEVILLENVTCQSRFSTCRMCCPRSIYPWWHEIWLERVTEEKK